ncbi:hypothetical protein BRC81_06025 [Halobacteriales archaeon QS_1_68_20]|nr:MAG: hypothetical protein BRC81_06025 [Halobacteriales archaeon QS_1_68_20]
MTLYERLADLPLTVEGYDLRRREVDTSSDFTRVTTTFRLRGDGETGRGEDVCYGEADHDALRADPPDLPTGQFTFDEFSRALSDVALFPEPPEQHHAPSFRRWAVESAALDLALRQADASLAAALDRTYDPVRFVVSTRLGEAGFDRIEELLAANPGAEFKLDPTADWSPTLIDHLAETGRVRVLDLKGLYEGTEVDADPDRDLYRQVVEAFPDAVIEDPALTEETRSIFRGQEGRLSWDYPITGVESVRELPVDPSWLNVKPSRFGTVRSLLETVEYAIERDVTLYGGGQFELGVGRRHLHALASLFYPGAPNDVAPSGYNENPLPGDLPASPLSPPDDPEGMDRA